MKRSLIWIKSPYGRRNAFLREVLFEKENQFGLDFLNELGPFLIYSRRGSATSKKHWNFGRNFLYHSWASLLPSLCHGDLPSSFIFHHLSTSSLAMILKASILPPCVACGASSHPLPWWYCIKECVEERFLSKVWAGGFYSLLPPSSKKERFLLKSSSFIFGERYIWCYSFMIIHVM